MQTPSQQVSTLREATQIFLVSLALMLFEVNLVRLFSILTYYHLAFFVLAIALFGIGLGGLYGQLIRERLRSVNTPPVFTRYLPFLLGISIMVAVTVLLIMPLGQATTEGAITGKRWLLGAFLVAAAPFFFGSAFVSMVFAARADAANKLYFSDLIGASAGCLVAVPALQWLGGLTTPFLAAAIALLAVLIARTNGGKLGRIGAGLALVGVAAVAWANEQWDLLNVPKREYAECKTLYSKWNFFSRIEVEEFPKWRGWRPSLNYTGPVPDHLRITQDGRAPAFIVRFDGDLSKVEYLRYDITGVPFYLGPLRKALVVGVGGGRDILTAKLFGVSTVKGVELNPAIVEAMRGPFREYSGNVYGMEGVEVVVDNGRTFMDRDTDQYDLIFQSLADTQLANTQGAYVLSENYLYTVEAYESYWERLTPNGICCTVGSVSWGDQLIRFVGTAAKALENKGIPAPSAHMLVIMTQAYGGGIMKGMCMVMTKNPVTPDALDKARKTCDLLGYDLVWPCQGSPHEWTQGVAQLMDPARRDAFLAAQYLDLSPLVDDRPYLFYGTKPRALLRSLINLGRTPETEALRMRAFHLLIDIFLVAFGCVLVLMLSPLVLFRRSEFGRQARRLQLGLLAVFFLLGVGYMLIEVSVLQQLFLLLGNPILTFSVTLCVMLAFTGIGSLMAGRVPTEALWRFLSFAGVAVVLLQIGMWLTLPPVLKAVQGANLGTKFLVVILVLAALATPMGMLFPSTIRVVGRSGLNMTCWVWGMNGVGSVLGSVAATLISMNAGIHATFLVGTAAYCGVALLAIGLGRRRLRDVGPGDAA